MPLIATRKAQQNHRGLDPWTMVHLATGLAFGLVGISRRRALTAAVTYEVLEQAFERLDAGKRAFRTSGPESPLNACLDVAVFALGHRFGELWDAT